MLWDPNKGGHITKLRHYDDTGSARFVTFNCYRNQPYLNAETARFLLIDELDGARSKHGFKLLAYVIMPDHVHLVLHPPDGMALGLVIREIKSRTARRFFADIGSSRSDSPRVFWQKRCFDHNCRTMRSTIDAIHYCHNNPVRAGLVADPSGWKWSSFNSYETGSGSLLAVDPVEL